MKQRFSSLDVKVLAIELSKNLCSLRLANIYDLSSRIFLFKFAKPDYRQQMVVDSGFRCHLTEFARTKAATPSIFVTRLRKYLRTRRVTSVSQIGTDRIIEIQFSDGQYRLFLEFYAGGNIVLTDKDLTILSLFRIVIEGASQEELRIGLTYSLSDRQNYNGIPLLTKERVRNGLQGVLDQAENDPAAPVKKPKKKAVDGLRRALVTSLNEFPPTLIDHALGVTAFEPSTKIEEVLTDDSLLDRLMLVLGEAQSVIDGIIKSEIIKGYIIAKPLVPKVLESRKIGDVENDYDRGGGRNLIYEDFHPFRPQQNVEDPGIIILEFGSFNRTVDEFFSSVEAQKLESRLSEREETARKKLEAAKHDHEKRVSGLQQVQEMHIRKAQAIETNLQRVQEVITVINGLISQGMDWVEIARLIEMEQARSNAVAEMIKLPLKLFENTVTLSLAEADFDHEEDFEGDETGSDVSESENENGQELKSRPAKTLDGRLAVDIDLALSPWSNARQYYDQKKVAAVKEQKTLQSSAKAVRNTEKKINTDLKKGLKQEKQVLRPLRKPFWFEKFIFFISSENYLVLAGKDAQQNEILYKKYLRKGDVYVHADLDRATPVIIKNHHENIEDPIPPSTLSQAGTLAVATSKAWESKAIMAAWWAKAEQVSKITPAGDLLDPGEFIVRDPKTYLPPAQLLLGFGLLFRVSEESKARHLKHRFPDDAMPMHERIDTTMHDGDGLEIQAGLNEEFQNDVLMPPTFLSSDKEQEDTESEIVDRHSLQPDAIHRRVEESDREGGFPARDQSEIVNHSSTSQSSEDELSEATQENDSKRDNEALIGFQSDVPDNDGGPCNTNSLEINPDQTTGLSNSFNSSSAPSISIRSRTKEVPLVRGKKGKRRKIKDKYGDQDDEDRALALHLLGSASAREKTREDLALKHNQDQRLAEQRQKQKEQHAIAIVMDKEAEEIRKSNFEKGINSLEDAPEEYVDLEAFLGTPLVGDEIVDVLAMCGPWDAIGTRCRWRAKLQPGMTKRGKAVKEILGSWIAATDRQKKKSPNTADGSQATTDENITRKTEEELLRGLQEHEVVGLVPVGKCRVMMGLGNASASKSKGSGTMAKGHRSGRGSKKPR